MMKNQDGKKAGSPRAVATNAQSPVRYGLHDQLEELRRAYVAQSSSEIARASRQVARTLRERDRPYHALKYLNEARNLLIRQRAATDLVPVMYDIGAIQFNDLVDMESAAATYRECASMEKPGRRSLLVTAALVAESGAYAALGDRDRAMKRAGSALERAANDGTAGLVAAVHGVIAYLHQSTDIQKSLEHFFLSYDYRRSDDAVGRSVDLFNIGRKLIRIGEYAEAEVKLRRALDLLDGLDDTLRARFSHYRHFMALGIPQLRLHQQEPEKAFEILAEILVSTDASKPRLRRSLAYAYLMAGKAHAMMGDGRRASACANRAMRYTGRMSDNNLVAEILRLWAEIAEQSRGRFTGWAPAMDDDDVAILDDAGCAGFASPSPSHDLIERNEPLRQLESSASNDERTSRQLLSSGVKIAHYRETMVRLRHRIDPLLFRRDECGRLANDLLKLIDRTEDVAPEAAQLERPIQPSEDSFLHALSLQFPDLTATELKICTMLRANLSSKEIADVLNISLLTAETHRKHIRRKCGLRREENLQSFLLSIR